MVNVLIKNGRVIDPENGIDDYVDVAIKDGKIFEVGKNFKFDSKSTFNANGFIVTPGLIDAHVHCYQYATPLGINPDSTCLTRGVTTVVDAGSSGASTFMGLRKYVVDQSKTRVRCLLHLALHGLAAAGCSGGASGGESDTLAVLDEEKCVRCIESNRDVIVGVKIRLSSSVCDKGRLEPEAFRRALSVAKRCGVPLMVHHSDSTVPTQSNNDIHNICLQNFGTGLGCPKDLQAGDIYTHAFHGWQSTIIDQDTLKIHSDVISARSRGVLFDCGHGAGAFNWTVAEIAAKEKFWPDLIGTDLHTLNTEGPAYDLTTVMTKFLHLGMPLRDLIRAVTSSPAHAYGLTSVGSLTKGKEADVTVISIKECDVMLEDCVAQTRNVKERVKAVAVWRAGEEYRVLSPEVWPNPKALEASMLIHKNPLIKDIL